jgi:hypothetical protein
MAHHNNTPRSVLEAPELKPIVLVEHTGPSRRMRRHIVTKTGKRYFVPKSLQPAATNSPVRRSEADE